MSKHWLRQDYGFRNDFWYQGYEELNSMPYISNSNFLDLQARILQVSNLPFQNTINEINTKIKEVNQRIKNNGLKLFTDDFYTSFLKVLNQGFSFYETKGDKHYKNLKKTGTDWDNYISEIKNFMSAIIELVNLDESHKNRIDAIINSINNSIRSDSGGSFYNFQQKKSDLAEEVASLLLQASGLTTFLSGKTVDNLGHQIAQDLLVKILEEDKKTTNSQSLFKISFKQTNTESYQKAKELKELISQRIKEAEVEIEKNGWISLEVGSIDNAYQLAKKLSNSGEETIPITIKFSEYNTDLEKIQQQYLGVQVKSGTRQHLLNESKKYEITLNQLLKWDNYYLALLKDFYFKYNKDEKVKQQGEISQGLSNYTNYLFSLNIADTCLGLNQIYFSDRGIGTLDQIMNNNGFYYKLQPNPSSLYTIFDSGVNFVIAEAHS